MRISVILPVHSETESLKSVAERLIKLIGDGIYEIILIVSPESPMETFKVCQGLNYVGGTHVLMMDSDGEMLPETVPNIIEKIVRENCDMVVASRWMKGGGAIGYTAPKYVFVHLFNAVFRFLYRTRIHDLSLGFKLMRVEVAKKIHWEGEYHEIAVETTLRHIRFGYKVGEVPTVWVRRKRGKSKNWMRANIRYIVMAIRIWMGR